MKKLFCLTFLVLSSTFYSQKTVTIKVSVPDKNDEVYISGNQWALGNWNPSQVKMEKSCDLERTITLPLNFPVEFKFTRGNWDSEGISGRLENNPNFKIENEAAIADSYHIKSWKDRTTSEEATTIFKVEHVWSKYFGDKERLIKIYLPEPYDASKKYPVLYVLDGYSLFETAALYVKQLTNAEGYFPENIPGCIVVGIYHENRGYETFPDFTATKYSEGSENLNQFITRELMPVIAEKYPVSGYNMIAGHSNTAHFVVNELFQAEQPFNGIISLSLGGTQFTQEQLHTYLKSGHKTSLFLGYGSKDGGFNEISKYIETELLSGNLSGERLKVGQYNATHNQMPDASLFDGIRFMFNQYRNFNDFPTALAKPGFRFENYANEYASTMSARYGISAGLVDADFDYLLEVAVNFKNKAVFNQMISYYEAQKKSPYFLHLKFYYCKKMGDFQSARAFAYEMLESKDENDQQVLHGNIDKYVFLFDQDLKKPEEAILFLEKAIEKVPKNQLRFRYFIAKTAIENKIQTSKARKALEYCFANFKENKMFIKDDLLQLNRKLQQ